MLWKYFRYLNSSSVLLNSVSCVISQKLSKSRKLRRSVFLEKVYKGSGLPRISALVSCRFILPDFTIFRFRCKSYRSIPGLSQRRGRTVPYSLNIWQIQLHLQCPFSYTWMIKIYFCISDVGARLIITVFC